MLDKDRRKRPARLAGAKRRARALGSGAAGLKREPHPELRPARPRLPESGKGKPAATVAMNPLPGIRHTPEEDELRQKRAQLETLEAELFRREHQLAELMAEVLPFESRYVRKVGIRSAKLDEIEAQIAEFQARRHPDDPALAGEARRTRERAARSRAEVLRHVSTAPAEPPASLKRLYRSVARRVHPDFGEDSTDREVRERLMSHANHAYQRCDERRLRGILTEYQFRPEAVQGEGTPIELVRAIRRIALIRGRLEEIEKEAAETRTSSLFRFKVRAEAAAREGRDLLAEAASAFSARIAGARLKLKNLSGDAAATRCPNLAEGAGAASFARERAAR